MKTWTGLLVFGLAVNAWIMGGIYMAIMAEVTIRGGWMESIGFLAFSAASAFYGFLLAHMVEVEDG
jgi:hypothetical protein